MEKKTSYVEKLKDPRWQKLRLEVFQRDGFACRICGAVNKPLNAHHSFYESGVEGVWDYDPRSIVTLCDDCHKEEHQYLAQVKSALIQQVCIMGFSTTEKMAQLNDILTAMWLGRASAEARETFNRMIAAYWDGEPV